MSAPKRILIVEDHYETIDYIRNAFTLLSERVDIISIPSGEEAWLELLREEIDLIMVDLRLPGMSGGELLARVQKRFTELPAIVMSGSALEMMKRETAGLTIHRFIEKPMDTDALLNVVEETLFGRRRAADLGQKDIPAEMQQQLEKLRVDTGARQLLLASLDGKLLFQSGEETRLTLADILPDIGESVRSGLAVAQNIGAEGPRVIQHLSTVERELYFANIGSSHFVALVYGAESQRTRIGTIWVFLRRAVQELQQRLAELAEKASAELAAAPETEKFIAAAVEEKEPEPEPAQEDIPMGDPVSLEEAVAQGLLPDSFVENRDVAAQAFDLFGDDPAEASETAAADEELEELALLMGLAGESLDEVERPDEDAVSEPLDLSILDEEDGLDESELEAFWDAAIEAQTEDEPPKSAED